MRTVLSEQVRGDPKNLDLTLELTDPRPRATQLEALRAWDAFDLAAVDAVLA